MSDNVTKQHSRIFGTGGFMKKMIEKIKQIWADESAQGATEYILLLVVIVGIAMIFRTRITEILTGKISELGDGINSFSTGQ